MILWIYNRREVSLSKTLVVRILSIPFVVEVVVSHLGMVLVITASVLAILEWECPRAVCLVVTLSIVLVAVVCDSEEVLVGAAFVALILTSPQFVVVGIESKQTAGYNFIGILNSLLKTAWSSCKRWIGLCLSNSSHF